jgi:hypothetical protein
MKLRIATVSAALLCIGIAGNAHGRVERTSTQQTLHFAGPGAHTLDVRNINGSISVAAYDGHDVELTINKWVRAGSDDDMRAADREATAQTSEDADAVRVLVKLKNQGVCGEESRHHYSSWFDEPSYDVRFDFTVRVPPDTRLQLCTINGGDVNVKGTRSDFAVRNVNGRITMTDVAGWGEASTVNGPVKVSFVATPSRSSRFSTINGDVVLTLPGRAAADLRMKSLNGGLYTDFEVRMLPAESVHLVEKRDGMSVYRSNGFTSVRIADGGPELTLDTLNGDVRVLRRSP